MAKVKGSVQYSMMVVPYRPGMLWFKRFLALALVAVLMGAAFWYGNYQARQQGLSADQAVYLRNKVMRLTSALTSCDKRSHPAPIARFARGAPAAACAGLRWFCDPLRHSYAPA